MATLLKIQSSLFGNQGQSSALISQFAQRWLEQHPHGKVISRDLAADPVPHLDLERFRAFITAPNERTPAQQQTVAYSDALIEELKSAEVIAMGVPMYNYSVPSVLRAYFDHLARAGVTFRYTANGPEGLLKGKRAYVFITRGGIHGEDHSQTKYLREFLGFVGITDVEIIHAEGLALNEGAKLKSITEAQGKIMQLLAA
jgi:FMN-dependent NADH-azoreductase